MGGVLILSNDPRCTRLMKADLERHDYEVQDAETEGVSLARAIQPTLVLLDLDLPGVNGLHVVNELRSWSNAPVIVLSSRSRQEEIIELLDAGADDYLTKPFGVKELHARMKVALRRKPTAKALPVFVYGDLTVDFDLRLVSVRGSVIRLTPSEYLILSILSQYHGEVVQHARLQRELWSKAGTVGAKRLRVLITQLRRKIERDPSRPKLIFTESGIGYRLGSTK
jgi:two-component system, OmpR family, KDP operon response regulator KdpE